MLYLAKSKLAFGVDLYDYLWLTDRETEVEKIHVICPHSHSKGQRKDSNPGTSYSEPMLQISCYKCSKRFSKLTTWDVRGAGGQNLWRGHIQLSCILHESLWESKAGKKLTMWFKLTKRKARSPMNHMVSNEKDSSEQIDPAIPFLRIYPKKMKTGFEEISALPCHCSLFLIVKIWQHPKCFFVFLFCPSLWRFNWHILLSLRVHCDDLMHIYTEKRLS